MKESRSGNRPPAAARLLLSIVLSSHDRRFALADLAEEFEERSGRDGRAAASRWYRWQAVRSTAPALASRARRRVARLHRGREGRVADRRVRPGAGLKHVPADFRYVARTLAKAPVVVGITVASLGLGVGAVTTVFAVADGLLYPPAVGLREPERLVTIYRSEDDGEAYGTSSLSDFERLEAASAIEDAAAISLELAGLRYGDEQETVFAERVSANYFTVTGIRPVIGRPFVSGALSEEGARVAILGHGLWTRRFGADPAVVSRTLQLDDQPYTVIGIAPEGLVSRRAPVRPDVWLPLETGPTDPATAPTDSLQSQVLVLARLAEGADAALLSAELDVLATRRAEEDPEGWIDDRGDARRFSVVAERESRLNPHGRMILGWVAAFFLAIAGLILLIASANVTSLFLVRARRRSREISVRIALGASRVRVVSLLLLEGVVLGALAGLVGVGMAVALTELLASAALPIDIPIRFDFDVGARARGLAFTVALATGVVFSLVPAWGVSRPDLVRALKGGAASGRRLGGRAKLRDALVVVQFAAALVLIVGAGLFTRSLHAAKSAELGLDPDGVAVMTKHVPEELGPDEVVEYYRDLLAGLQGAPGARAAALSRGLELTLLQVGTPVSVTVASGDPEGRTVYRNSVTPGYLEMLSIPVVRGRSITDGDGPSAPRVAVVSETLAARSWPDGNPLGRRLVITDRSPGATEHVPLEFEVVGVARDAAYLDIGDPPTPYVWTSLFQDPARTVAVTLAGNDAEALASELSSRVELEPGEVPLVAPSTYRAQLSLQYVHLELASSVLGWGGGFGLFLGLIGVYGLVSFVVAERTREMAIRMAIGAHRRDLVRRLIRYALVLAATGSVIGLVVVLPAARLLRSVLVGVGPADPLSLAAGLGLLFATAALAAFVPARRATRIDPMLTLRQE